MINSSADQSSKRGDLRPPLHVPVLTARSSFDGQKAKETARGPKSKANTTRDRLEHPRIETRRPRHAHSRSLDPEELTAPPLRTQRQTLNYIQEVAEKVGQVQATSK